MFPGKKISYLLALSIFLIILFDAFQQKFYLDTFNLYPDEPIPLLSIIKNHLSRWFIWSLVSISYLLYLWKKFTANNNPLKSYDWGIISLFVVFSNILSIFFICLFNVIQFSDTWSISAFKELFIFMFYQKGLSFTFASSLLVLLIYNRANSLVIDAQWIEIKHLKDQAFPSFDSGNPSLTIKIGNKLKVIPIREVRWFEADDYCVKVHTSEKSYTMRKSLKSLQKELASLNFIRVHRRALLNLEYLDHVDFHSSTVKLKDTSEISLSKSGANLLKEVLQTNSV
ncbi:MAG: LytR/AlgR family response regulator transcription factor [Balneola sp.]